MFRVRNSIYTNFMPHAQGAPGPGDITLAAFAAQIVPDRSAAFGPWFTATYGGDCDGCGGEIVPGDEIRADGHGGWLCSECGADPDPEYTEASRQFIRDNDELMHRLTGIENPHGYHEAGDY